MNIRLYTTEVQNWIKEVQLRRGKDSKGVLSYCDKIEAYGKKAGDDALIGFACFSRGETYYLMNDMRDFYSQMLACLAPLERIGEWGYIVVANNMLGIMSLNRGNAPFAMDYYMKALNYCRIYKLPDLTWIVHMNMGALYLNIEDNQKALEHFENGYQYISAHPEREDYVENLTMAYLGMAKAYFNMDLKNESEKYTRRIKKECAPYLNKYDLLVVYCFLARFYREENQTADFDAAVENIRECVEKDIPIMDIFDDIHDYMKMLIDVGMYEEFDRIYEKIRVTTEETGIKNLEKKLLTLKIEQLKKTKKTEEYKAATIVYFELSEQMEKENRLMVSSMIGMRNHLNDLVAINREVEQENKALHKKSETDPLTGLYNRSKLQEYGEKVFHRCCREKISYAIEILDIDYFKQYNDNYGHQAGDEAIKSVADKIHRLKKYKNVFCSRYGGDEFVIIYVGYTKAETLKMAEELKRSIVEKQIPHLYSKTEKFLTISQGICWGVPNETEEAKDYLHTADELLYKAKKISRNSIRIGSIEESCQGQTE